MTIYDSTLYKNMTPISLRPLEPEDLELMYTMENDPELWLSTSDPHPYSKYAIRQYLANQPQDIFQCGEMRNVIQLTPQGEAIGFVDIVNFSPSNLRAEICISILSAHRGKGYGHASLCKIEQWAKEMLNIRLLYAHISCQHNPACKSLFLSSGYTLVATLPLWHKRGMAYEDIDVLTKIL